MGKKQLEKEITRLERRLEAARAALKGESPMHLSTSELAVRWRITEQHLRRLRMNREGPDFVKFSGKVLYPLAEIERYEAEHRISFR